MSFFENDFDDYSSDDNCPHDIIEDNHHCKLCGEIMETLILPDDINTEDNPGPKKIVVDNAHLLNIIKDINLEQEAKFILSEEIEKGSLKIKSGKDSINKLIFLYGFKYLIYPKVIECSPGRWARICGITITSQLIKVIDSCYDKGDGVRIIMPDVLVKEFLYDLQKNNNIPSSYDVEHGDKLSRFCRYIIKRKSITSAYEEPPNLKIKNKEGLDQYIVLKGDIDHNKLPSDEVECRLENLNGDFLSGRDIEIIEKEAIFDLPQKIAAITLFSALHINLQKIDYVDTKGKISANNSGDPEILPYTEEDICTYFSISLKTLITLSSEYGIKKMKVRSRRAVKVGAKISSRT